MFKIKLRHTSLYRHGYKHSVFLVFSKAAGVVLPALAEQESG